MGSVIDVLASREIVDPAPSLTLCATSALGMVNTFWLDRDLVRTATWTVGRHVTSSVIDYWSRESSGLGADRTYTGISIPIISLSG